MMPEGPEEIGTGTIVVGVDGSEHSRSALKWACDEAGRRGSFLKIMLRGDRPVPARPSLVPVGHDRGLSRAGGGR